jgi:DNA primase
LRGTGHEHLNGSVIVPLWACGPGGEPGPVAQLYGRKITANLREGTPEHLYLPGPQRGVWNAAGVAGQREWLVCEALLDALTLWCAGFRNVTSAYGVNGWTAEHWALLDAQPPERVIVCFDNDEAGNQASMRFGGELELRGVKVWRAKLPPGKDINEVARESDDAAAALAEVIEAAPRIFALNAPDAEAKASAAPPVAVPVESKPEVSSAPVDAEEVSSSLAALAAAALPLAAETEDAAKRKSAEPVEPDAHGWTFGERQWRVRGIAKNPSYETLRVQLRVWVERRTGPAFHLDTLDLCNAKHRANFVEAAHLETGVGTDHLKRDLAQVLLKAEEQQETFLRKTSEPSAKPWP